MTELVCIRHHVAVINRTYKKKLFIEFSHVIVMPMYKGKLESSRTEGIPFLVRLLLAVSHILRHGLPHSARSGLRAREIVRCVRTFY